MMNNANELSRSARVLPRRYGVIDQCLVDAGYFKKLSSEALCLYAFLCVVADRRGRSWYSDSRLLQLVRLTCVNNARTALVESGLIAWDAPVYSVLNVPVRPSNSAPPQAHVAMPKSSSGKTLSQEEIEKLVAHLR
ncbi:MAG: hypothetical protein HN572_01210 [Kordiimonadaceae bacterium]|jgi:hypothetical protein|nr:hypothetical protein [Kordiimonadaceae bacterium]